MLVSETNQMTITKTYWLALWTTILSILIIDGVIYKVLWILSKRKLEYVEVAHRRENAPIAF